MTSILNSRGFTAWKNGRNPCQRMCRWVLQGRLIIECQAEFALIKKALHIPKIKKGAFLPPFLFLPANRLDHQMFERPAIGQEIDNPFRLTTTSGPG